MTLTTLDPVGTEPDCYGDDTIPSAGPTQKIASLAAGLDDAGKSGVFGWGSFIRFELPAGTDDATINGVSLRLFSSLTNATGLYDYVAYFVDPDHAKSEWVNSGGFSAANYPRSDDLPFYTVNSGGDPSVPAVLFEGTHAFTHVNYFGKAAGTDLTWYEGTGVSGITLVTGLVAKLQAYLASPAAQAHRSGGILPVCIALTWEPVGGPLNDYWQFHHSSRSLTPAFRPRLEFDWTAIAPGFVRARLDLESAANGKPDLSPAVSARASVDAAISGKIEIEASVSERATLSAAVSGKGDMN